MWVPVPRKTAEAYAPRRHAEAEALAAQRGPGNGAVDINVQKARLESHRSRGIVRA